MSQNIPGKSGIVTRPDYVKVKALNERGEEYVLEGEGLLEQDAFVMSVIILMVFCTADKAEGGLINNEDLPRRMRKKNCTRMLTEEFTEEEIHK